MNFNGFEVIDGDFDAGMVILADHAMNCLPEEYGTLGLAAEAFERHIAYDIGIESLTRALSAKLGVPAVMARFSRLLIDPNRGEDDPTLIMKISDGAIISGNHPISDEEWSFRLNNFHRPYHEAVSQTISKASRGKTKGDKESAPLVLSLHSFTPFWKEFVRPWHAAVLWDNDPRAVYPLLDLLRERGDIIVGDNEPYDGALKGDTMHRHCMLHGIPHALIEVRQDLIADKAGVDEWTERLAPIFSKLNADPNLHELRQFPSRTSIPAGHTRAPCPI